jgi:hypothetical protein
MARNFTDLSTAFFLIHYVHVCDHGYLTNVTLVLKVLRMTGIVFLFVFKKSFKYVSCKLRSKNVGLVIVFRAKAAA